MAQLNPIVGDVRGNLQRALQVLSEVGPETDLLVLPELFLTGYPPKDLLERDWFIDQVEAAVQELLKVSITQPQTGVLCGAPWRTGRDSGKGLTNSALLIYQGKIVLNQAKSLLPTYDVFDEARHFDSATAIKTVEFKDELLAVSICEDAWNDQQCWPKGQVYNEDPIAALADQGATLILNISASPFHMGKDAVRYQLLSGHARRHRIPLVFVNQVGGNDELVFDGGSMALDHRGEPIALGPFFQEQVTTIDTAATGIPEGHQPLEPIASVYQALVLGTHDYLGKCGFSGAVIGLSGGIDSAVTCCLAVAALGPENVLGIAMPSPFSSPGSVTDSEQLARNLGIKLEVVPISALYDSYLQTLRPYFKGRAADVTEENIQARIRGNILMAFSNKLGYLALSTGNKSELAVGYCTLYGDMSGGLSVISDVPKTLVYQLAEYINRTQPLIPEAIITKPPSAELKPDQRDQDTLPPYPILDQILQYYIEEGDSIKELIERGFDPATVKWVVQTIDSSEYKRRQAAPGLKVTTKAFGMGRRMPVAKKLNP